MHPCLDECYSVCCKLNFVVLSTVVDLCPSPSETHCWLESSWHFGSRDLEAPVPSCGSSQPAMLRQAILVASRQARAATCLPAVPLVRPQLRAFGALAERKSGEAVRPFVGASPSEPKMEYVEEPSMLYMTFLLAVPLAFQMWFLTKFV